MGNIKPLSPTIVFNRLQKMYKFSDYDLAKKVERFWETKWPIDYLERGMTTQEIIKQKTLPIINFWLENSVPKRRRIREKKFQVILRNCNKKGDKLLKELKRRKAEDRDSKRKQRVEIVRRFIDEFNEIRRYYFTDASYKKEYRIDKIPKWLNWSDEKIEKKVIEILREIRLLFFHRDQKMLTFYDITRGQNKIEMINKIDSTINAMCLNRTCNICHPGRIIPKPVKFLYFTGAGKDGKTSMSQDSYRMLAEIKNIRKVKRRRFIKFDEEKFAAEVSKQLGYEPEPEFNPETGEQEN